MNRLKQSQKNEASPLSDHHRATATETCDSLPKLHCSIERLSSGAERGKLWALMKDNLEPPGVSVMYVAWHLLPPPHIIKIGT